MRRIPKCSECGKPLGGTYGRCYECGGSKQVDPPGTQPMYDSAFTWKVWFLGIPRSVVEAAHEESKERNPRYDSEEEQWKHE